MAIQSMDEAALTVEKGAPTPLQRALSPKMLRQSLLVALVVGTILCLINQGDALISGQPLNVWKIVLTFIVPFLVSTYGAWNMARASMSGD